MEHYRNATGTLQSASALKKHSWRSIFQKDMSRANEKTIDTNPRIRRLIEQL
jgi:hypothetical protein